MTLCSIDSCSNNAIARGWCANHYARWQRHGDPEGTSNRWDGHTKVNKICAVEGCTKCSGKSNYCSMHRQRKLRHGDVNTILPHARTYVFNEHILDVWTPKSAYFLGWLVTDGCVTKDNRTVTFDLKDEEATNILRNILDHPKKPTKMRDAWRVAFHSKYLVQRLAEFGIGPAKSLTLEHPDVPMEVFSHYLRGVIEGDGSITVKPFRIILNSASVKFLQSLQERIPFTGSLFEIGKGKRKNPLYRLVYSGKQAQALGAWIYQDSEHMRLARKYDRYQTTVG